MLSVDSYSASRTSLLVCALLFVCASSTLMAQDEPSSLFAFGASAGLHGLGVLLEVTPLTRVALDFQAEGLNLGGKAVAGLGARVDAVHEQSARAYGRLLFGTMGCNRSVGGTSSCLSDGSWRRAWSPAAGVELRLSDQGITWVGIEAGYWFGIERDAVSRDLEHFSFAGIIRFRWR